MVVPIIVWNVLTRTLVGTRLFIEQSCLFNRKLRCYLELPLGGVSYHALEIREPSGERSFVPFFTLYKSLNRVPWRYPCFA